jgi:hypothetical protein
MNPFLGVVVDRRIDPNQVMSLTLNATGRGGGH